MKRVNVVYGILERLNDILGCGTNGALNSWSIQGVLLENLKRAAKALAGSNGRIGYGLTLSSDGAVSSGVGFTASGEIVYWNGGNCNITSGDVYLKYVSAVTTGHETNVVAGFTSTTPTTVEIVYDNSQDASECFTNTPDTDTIYIGNISAGVVTRPKSGFQENVYNEGSDSMEVNVSAPSYIEIAGGSKMTSDSVTTPIVTTQSIILNSGSITLDGSTITGTGNINLTGNGNFTNVTASGELNYTTIKATGVEGVSGTITDAGGSIITITKGIITEIA